MDTREQVASASQGLVAKFNLEIAVGSVQMTRQSRTNEMRLKSLKINDDVRAHPSIFCALGNAQFGRVDANAGREIRVC